MKFDYSKLKGRIIEKYGSQEAFAKAMQTSQRTLSQKMTGKIYFRQDEINKAMDLLSIESEEASAYFFTPKVQ